MADLYQKMGVEAPPKKDLYTKFGATPSPKKVEPTMAQKAGDLFTGNLRETRATQELPEAMSQIGLRNILGDVPIPQAMAATSSFLTAYDDEEAYKILEANAAHPISRQWDEKGNMIIAYGPDQKRALMNRPGFSSKDAMQLSGTTALYAPAGSVTGTGLKGLAKIGLAASATEAGIQAGQEATGGSFDKLPIAMSGLSGMIFKYVGDKLAAKFPKAFGRSETPPVTEMREYARKELIEIGFKPQEVTDDMVNKMVDAAKGATDPKMVPAVAGEKEFGIPLTQGGRTLNQKQLSLEDSLRVGLGGEKARNTMTNFDNMVVGKVDEAVDTTRQAVGGGVTRLDKATAGSVISQGVKEAEEVAYQGVNDAYADVGTAALDTKGVHKLLNATRKAVLGIDKDRGLPQTASLLNQIAKTQKQMVAAEKAIGKLRPTDFKQLELLRRRIGTAIGSADGSDYGQTTAMRRAFDDWVDQAVINDLFKGESGSIANMKAARGIYRQYAGLFRDSPSIGRAGIKIADREGKLIEKIVAANPTGEEVTNAIFGASGLSNTSGGRMADRMKAILGTESVGWKAIREEAFRRLVQTNSVNGKQIVSGQKSLTAFNRAMENNQTLMHSIFSTEEIGTMRRLFSHIQRTTPDILRSRENPSGTVQKLKQFVDILGMGDITMAIASKGVEIASGMTSASKAASSIRPFAPVAPVNPVLIGAGEALQTKATERFRPPSGSLD